MSSARRLSRHAQATIWQFHKALLTIAQDIKESRNGSKIDRLDFVCAISLCGSTAELELFPSQKISQISLYRVKGET